MFLEKLRGEWERSRAISYKQASNTSCRCQNSADRSAVGGTNSSRPIKSNEGLSLSLGRDERVQAFACKQPNNSISALEESSELEGLLTGTR